jgi:phosphoribosylanthranilate isomerase
MGVQIKICGINSVEAADAAVSAGADFAGLVFYKKSPRNVAPAVGARLADQLRNRVKVVALFVDPGDDELHHAIGIVRPDFLQLHGCETPERAAAIRSRFGVPVVKAVPVADAGDLKNIRAYEDVADMLLFDAKGATPGGNGAAFDWQLLRGRSFTKPWFLAGGLNAGNVARAIQATGAQGVDVSSGVETAPGVKDARMIREFISEARA